MAATQAIRAEIPLKPVQDILESTAQNVPDIFTRDSANRHPVADPASALPWMDNPVIDFALLSASLASHHAQPPEELAKLHSALLSWGCFLLVNHGIRDSFLEEVRELSKQFFLLPLEERSKCLRAPNDPEGYGNDTIMSENVPHNWNDRLFLKVYPENERKLSLWPQTPLGFREMLHEYTMKVNRVHEILLEAMARCLGLEDKSFIEECGETMRAAARINYYPKCPFPELVRAARAHTDASILTILLPDKEVDGLQVLKEDEWFKVPIIPSALFVNVGDQMEILSNGIFKGAVHRVVANSDRERLSLAIFSSADYEKEIGPLNKLISNDHPALYKSTKNYIQLFFRYHPIGERPITVMKI